MRRRATGRRRLDVVVTSAAAARAGVRGLAGWLTRAAPARAVGRATIAIVSDARMRALNRQFRGKDEPTDVLSFPSGGESPGDPRDLGEIAIAWGVAGRQARAHGHARQVEIRILALHGLLHLLGYDHDTDRGEMRRLEARLGRKAGLPAVLTGRVPGHPSR
jgi:probable rRNA maturation factor